MKIIPAILENDLDAIKNKINYYSSLKEKYSLDFNLIQIDFCDGEFVENKNWLPENIDQLKDLVNLEKDFNLEIHLMCKDIRKYFTESIVSFAVNSGFLLKEKYRGFFSIFCF